MLQFVDIETFLQAQLTVLGYNPLPVFDPGPGYNLDAQDASPDQMVLVSIGAGAGFSTEQVFDQPMVQLRAIGKQSDYTDAEKLAQDCDKIMSGVAQSQFINGKWVTAINRVGGGPSLLIKDDGDRYHFTCNYIVEIEY
jgi:hypothetical protein